MERRIRCAVAVLLATLVACGTEADRRAAAPPDSAAAGPTTSAPGGPGGPPTGAAGAPAAPGASAQPPEGRPASRLDTLWLEGTAEPVELMLVRSPAGFPLPFTTYAPQDFVVEAAGAGAAPAVRFIAVFGGVRNDSAYLEVAAYPPGLGEAEARARAERAAGPGAAPVAPGESRFAWAVQEWRVFARGAPGVVLGFAALGRHAGRPFHIRARYPGEYADGFGPRADLVLEHWRWGDGAPLGPPAPR